MNLVGVWASIAALMGSLMGGAPGADDSASGVDVVSERLAASLDGLPPDASVEIVVEVDGPAAGHVAAAESSGLDVLSVYEIIDAFSARATVAQIEELERQPWVVGVWDSRPIVPLMDVSTKDIGAQQAWASGVTGKGITVAVIDTGIEVTDPDLADAIVACVATLAGLTLPECNDTEGHGTHVAGTVASRDATFRGVAPEASIAAVRVLHAAGAGTSADVIAGMDWVGRNKDRVSPPIRIATMSIGPQDPGCGDGRDPESKAADALVARGISFTIAAGNSGHAKCTVDGAASAFNVITVGAADDRNTASPLDDTLADFSSAGPTRDGRLKPELVAPGVNIRSLFLGPTIASLSGTSMATPHVAGVAALLLERESGLSPADVKSRLTGSTVAPTAAGKLPNEDWGNGLVNACMALRLADCGVESNPSPAPEPAQAGHVESIRLTFKHVSGGKHVVYTYATISDADGERLRGVKVSVDVTSPEGNLYERAATTDANGQARVQVTQAGGHGEWESCVTDLSISYDEDANRETCDRLNVT